MREIKFRALVDKNKEMVSPYFFVNDENFITQYGSSKPSAVMQYTGLKDKNGIEIYEVDILECDAGICWIVKFINGCFCACDPKEDENFVFLDDYDFEVIGNIYENPELLDESC